MSDFTHYREQIERLREAVQITDKEFMADCANSIEVLLRVAEAARTVVDYRDSGSPRDLKTLESALEQLQERKA